MDKLVSDPDALTAIRSRELVEQAGSQGVEVLNWIAMRGALTGRVTEVIATITSRSPTRRQPPSCENNAAAARKAA